MRPEVSKPIKNFLRTVSFPCSKRYLIATESHWSLAVTWLVFYRMPNSEALIWLQSVWTRLTPLLMRMGPMTSTSTLKISQVCSTGLVIGSDSCQCCEGASAAISVCIPICKASAAIGRSTIFEQDLKIPRKRLSFIVSCRNLIAHKFQRWRQKNDGNFIFGQWTASCSWPCAMLHYLAVDLLVVPDY